MKLFKQIIKMSKGMDFDYEDVMPFVISREVLNKTAGTEMDIDISENQERVIACPAREFSIEANDRGTLGAGMVHRSNGQVLYIQIHAIICREAAPGRYDLQLLFGTGTELGEMTRFGLLAYKHDIREDEVMSPYEKALFRLIKPIALNVVYNVVENMLNRFTTGFIVPKQKIGYRGAKRQFKKFSPKRVVLITDKRYEGAKAMGQEVDWSHAWIVRGHWRRLKNPETMGKNREGDYTEKGWTYVREYQKGEGELVHKTRVRV